MTSLQETIDPDDDETPLYSPVTPSSETDEIDGYMPSSPIRCAPSQIAPKTLDLLRKMDGVPNVLHHIASFLPPAELQAGLEKAPHPWENFQVFRVPRERLCFPVIHSLFRQFLKSFLFAPKMRKDSLRRCFAYIPPEIWLSYPFTWFEHHCVMKLAGSTFEVPILGPALAKYRARFGPTPSLLYWCSRGKSLHAFQRKGALRKIPLQTLVEFYIRETTFWRDLERRNSYFSKQLVALLRRMETYFGFNACASTKFLIWSLVLKIIFKKYGAASFHHTFFVPFHSNRSPQRLLEAIAAIADARLRTQVLFVALGTFPDVPRNALRATLAPLETHGVGSVFGVSCLLRFGTKTSFDPLPLSRFVQNGMTAMTALEGVRVAGALLTVSLLETDCSLQEPLLDYGAMALNDVIKLPAVHHALVQVFPFLRDMAPGLASRGMEVVAYPFDIPLFHETWNMQVVMKTYLRTCYDADSSTFQRVFGWSLREDQMLPRPPSALQDAHIFPNFVVALWLFHAQPLTHDLAYLIQAFLMHTSPEFRWWAVTIMFLQQRKTPFTEFRDVMYEWMKGAEAWWWGADAASFTNTAIHRQHLTYLSSLITHDALRWSPEDVERAKLPRLDSAFMVLRPWYRNLLFGIADMTPEQLWEDFPLGLPAYFACLSMISMWDLQSNIHDPKGLFRWKNGALHWNTKDPRWSLSSHSLLMPCQYTVMRDKGSPISSIQQAILYHSENPLQGIACLECLPWLENRNGTCGYSVTSPIHKKVEERAPFRPRLLEEIQAIRMKMKTQKHKRRRVLALHGK